MGYKCFVNFTYVPFSKNYEVTKSVPQGVSEGVKIVFLNGNVFLAQIISDYGKIINSKN